MFETVYIWISVIFLVLLISSAETNDLKYKYGKNAVTLTVIGCAVLWPLFIVYMIYLWTNGELE